MRILVLQHHPEEGPGSLGDFLLQKGAELKTVHAYDGETLPDSAEGFAALISMGGPMNVYEEDAHPWLAPENRLLAKAAQAGLPILGVCLGAQLLAKALGTKVVRSPGEEIGWYDAELTAAAAADPLLAGVAAKVPVMQWHGDMFQVPEGGRLLATGRPCPHQAFGYKNAYGFQFHVEVTPEILKAWFPEAERQKDILGPWDALGRQMDAAAQKIYENFWRLIVAQ
jgi:GMP synthase (glutamine-hydrolysing)